MSPIRHTTLLTATLACALAACGDDAGGGKGDAGADGGNARHDAGGGGGGVGGGKDAGRDAAMGGTDAGTDASVGMDAGSDAGDAGARGGKENFKLSAGNLSFDYVTDSGLKLSFEFPASAAGKTISVESVDPKSISWGNADFKTAFSDVIELGPDGTEFTPPVKVAASNGALIAFNFSDTESAPEPLVLAGNGKSLLLTHFSSLAFATELCDSVGGWTDTPDVQGCTGATNVFRNFGAKCYRFCYVINAGCCVDPSVSSDANDGCQTDSTNVYVVYQRSGTNGGDYPYCADGLPTTSDVTGSLVAGGGDQTITLTGTNFDPNGSVVINGNTVVATTWNSATSATATVPGSALMAAGTLTGIAYVNPTWNATGACTSGSLGNCDFANKSSPALTEPIAPAAGPSCLTGGSAASGVTGSGTCADPYVVFLLDQAIDAVVSHDVLQSTGSDEAGEPSSTQCGVSTTARDVVYAVQVPAGADFDVSVDAVVGVNPVIFVHEDVSCGQPINACADDGASGACEVARATRGPTFFGASPYVTIAEGVHSNTAFTTRFALRGAITTPTLVSVTPSPVTNMSGATMTATFSDYTMVNANGTITKASVFQESVFCDPVSATTCTFTLPNTLTAGVHDISFQFTGLAGTPTTNSVQFTVN